MTKRQLEDRVKELERRIDIVAEAVLGLRDEPKEPRQKTKADTRAEIIKADCDEANATPLPTQLDDEAFRPHWEEFCKWRTKLATVGRADTKKFNWTRHIAERLLSRCAKWGAHDAIAAIANSLDRYPDLYEPEDRAPGQGQQAKDLFVI